MPDIFRSFGDKHLIRVRNLKRGDHYIKLGTLFRVTSVKNGRIRSVTPAGPKSNWLGSKSMEWVELVKQP